MKLFAYVGDHENMTAFGLTFRTEGVDTPCGTMDKTILAKLEGNSHFAEVEPSEGEAQTPPKRGRKPKK